VRPNDWPTRLWDAPNCGRLTMPLWPFRGPGGKPEGATRCATWTGAGSLGCSAPRPQRGRWRRARSSLCCRCSASSTPSGRSAKDSAVQVAAFRQALSEAGDVEGRNVAIDYRWAEGQFDRLPELAAELVRRPVAVRAAPGSANLALAAKAATTMIPIVFAVGEDPVRLGLVASLAPPGGNLTGINFFNTELAAKRPGLLHELIPSITRVAVLVNPADATNTETTLRDVQSAARTIRLQIQVLNAGTGRETDAAFATLVRDRAEPLFVDGNACLNAGASNWSTWPRVTRSRRHMGRASFPRLAG
jgi:hypothetical protein